MRYALCGAAGLALCVVPWGLVFAIHGMNPITGENLSSAARLGEVSAAARDPGTLLARFGSTVRRLALSYVPYASPQIRGVPWSGPGPLGWLLPAIALGAIPRPAARPAISWRAMLAFAGALVVGQAVPVALAPSFDVQLELVADRAAMHLIPVLFLITFGLESWLRAKR